MSTVGALIENIHDFNCSGKMCTTKDGWPGNTSTGDSANGAFKLTQLSIAQSYETIFLYKGPVGLNSPSLAPSAHSS